jgi:hypothetical protein
MGRIFSLLAVLLGLVAAPAAASELSLGVYEHDIDDTFSFGHTEHGKQIVIGARTAPIDELAFIWRPRAHVIAGFNTKGGTDYVAAGLSWRLNFGGDRFYFEPGIGAAIHNGSVDLPSPYDAGLTPEEQARRLYNWTHKLDLGSRVLFEPEWSLGWRATDRLSLEISWIHLSHAQLAGEQNPGLGDFGVRAVYRYGVDRGRTPPPPPPRSARSDAFPKNRLPVNPPDVAQAAPQDRLPVNRPERLAQTPPPASAEPSQERLPVNPPGAAPAQLARAAPDLTADLPAPRRPSAPPLRAAVARAPAPAARSGDAAIVQIAASSTPQAAERALDGIKDELAGWPNAPGGRVQKAVVNGAVVYRALVAGFDDSRSAESFCARLRAAGQACFLRTSR